MESHLDDVQAAEGQPLDNKTKIDAVDSDIALKIYREK
jgi:hypothetical protein